MFLSRILTVQRKVWKVTTQKKTFIFLYLKKFHLRDAAYPYQNIRESLIMLFIKSLNRNFCFHFRRKIIGKFYFLRPEKGPRSSIFPRKNVKFTCLYCRYLVLQISCLYCRYLVCTADILSHKAY